MNELGQRSIHSATNSTETVRAISCSLEKIFSFLERGINDVAGALVIVLMFGAVFEIIGRRLFASPIRGYIELSEIIMGIIVFLGLSYTQRLGEHVRITLFINRLLKGRIYHVVESIVLILSLFIFSILTIYSLQFALHGKQVGDITGTLGLPLWHVKLCVPVGCFFLSVRLFIQLIYSVLKLLKINDGETKGL